ncbi:MAG: hypothetical protein AUI14_07105 [Actinobacteria bacterium 13_2_20CM_2_71_6]|nr:MAG: hypothetical protein AUI14_07105 [Actinobacteria bacterium 13_2_20CM_2_71_6]
MEYATSSDSRPPGPGAEHSGARSAVEAERCPDPRHTLTVQVCDIQRAVLRHAPVGEVFDAVSAGLSTLFGDGGVGLWMLDPDTPDTLILVSYQGLAEQQANRIWRVALADAGVTGQAVVRGELVVAEDYPSSGTTIAELAGSGVRAVMAAPVRGKGQVLGALVVASYAAGRTFDAAERELLSEYADQVGLAVASATMSEAMDQSFHDPLTGLASRALYLDRLTHALACAERDATPTAMLLLGLDRFRTVNDALGHAAGDLLLTEVAARLRTAVRLTDTPARLIGDEFAVLLHRVSDEYHATLIARRIMQALQEPFSVGGRPVFLTASVGIAFSDVGDRNPLTLMRRADLAKVAAKRNGKGRYEVYAPDMESAAHNPVDLEADLRYALDRRQLTLRYQPIVELSTARVTGFEALVRWEHPKHGLIPPLEFIPLAEETGLIIPIGAWVMREACAQVSRWNAERLGQPPLTISVNLSARQLQHPDLPRTVSQAFGHVGMPPGCLTLEITESMLLKDSEATNARLHALKALGVQLAIDDFGTGYSSLAYLRRFPVDIIKIDKMFVDDLTRDIGGATLTRAIVGLGRSLRLATIAEGIEAADQCEPLRDSGCELGQGFYFAKPLTTDEAGVLLAGPAGVRPVS